MTTELNQQDTTGLAAAAGAIVAAAAAQLGEAIGAPVALQPTAIAADETPAPGLEDVFVEAALSGAAAGSFRLILDGTDAGSVVAAVKPDHSEDSPLDEAALSALTEALQHFVSGAGTALSEGLASPVDVAAPTAAMQQTTEPAPGTVVVTITGQIAGAADAELFWLIEPALADAIRAGWGGSADPSPAADSPEPPAVSAPSPVAPAPGVPGGGVIDTVELDIAVELGNVAMTIGELLHMGEGSVVTLTQAVGDKVIMLANGTAVASGEVVVVDGTLGFRVAELITETPGA